MRLKTLIFTILFILLLVTLAPSRPAYADNWVFNDYPTGLKSSLEGSVNSPGYATHMDVNFESSKILQIVGAVPGITVTADAYQNDPQYVEKLNQQSALAGINNYIAMLYVNPPASTAVALRDMGQSLGFLPKQAYAQGVGFSALQPLLEAWKVFRNIAYLLLAIVMIVIGFMVMLQKKIDPKTVVTVQNALPRIIITLLLITFSYAIVGILIDLMYLLMLLFISLLVNAYPANLGADTATKYINGGLATTARAMFGGGWAAIDDLVKMIFYGDSIRWWINAVINVLTFGTSFGVQYVLVWLIVSIALLFGFVRVFFMLLTSYIHVIIALLVGPLQLLFDALPGGTGFSSWIKNLISNLSVFPVTAGMFLVGTILTEANVDKLWTPPLLGGAGATTRGITGLIGLGVLLTIPSVANSIKEALKAKPPIAAGPGAIIGPLGAGAGQVGQLIYQGSFIYSAFKHKPDTRAREEQLGDAARGEIAHKGR